MRNGYCYNNDNNYGREIHKRKYIHYGIQNLTFAGYVSRNVTCTIFNLIIFEKGGKSFEFKFLCDLNDIDYEF